VIGKMIGRPSPVRSRREILNVLKTEGPRDASSLGRRLRLSPMAVRQHLYALQDQKLVTYQEDARPVGRPAKVWSLKPAADRFFPDDHWELAVSLIGAIRESFGDSGLATVLSAVRERNTEIVRARVSGIDRLNDRLKAVASALTRRGYLTKLQASPDDSLLMITSHCPIFSAASSCPELCRHESEMIQALVGTGHVVERVECATADATRCVLRIRKTRLDG
jgi:predicted ArsR family transcriptional regulator